MKFGELTYQEIKILAKKNLLVVLPTGCTEQQGPHLPVDFDTWFVETVCNAAIEKIEQDTDEQVLLLPAPPYGPTPEHLGFGAGYVHIPKSIYIDYIQSILESVISQGFKQILIWRGCGEHNFNHLIKKLNSQYPATNILQPEMPYHKVWCEVADSTIPGGHADSFSTAIGMFLRPDLVHENLIEKPINTPINWDIPNLDISMHSNTGVIGDPTFATPELGKRLWYATINEVSSILLQYMEQ